MFALNTRISGYAVLLGFAGALAAVGSCNSSNQGGDGGGAGGSGNEIDAAVGSNGGTGGNNPPLGGAGGDEGPVVPPPPPCTLPAPPKLKLTRVAQREQPVLAVVQPAEDSRLFVAERHGIIRIIKEGKVLDEPFLDMTKSVGGYDGKGESEGERGLINLAFHPKFVENGRFYVFYTRSATDPIFDGTKQKGDVVIAEGRRSATNADQADPKSLTQFISIRHDGIMGKGGCCDDGHNGGLLEFGPDGYLYAGVGDGGDSANVHGAKVPGLSTIMRFNVEDPTTPPPGGLSDKGPLAFAWAKGVRNPFRGTFDSKTGDLYFGDVGEFMWEELNFVPSSRLKEQGLDFGWGTPGRNAKGEMVTMEGFRVVSYWPYKVPAVAPNGVLPAHEYEHPMDPRNRNNRLGRAIIGGVVYRGAVTGLNGRYFYGDYIANSVSSLVIVDGRGTCVVDHTEDLKNAETPIVGVTGFSNPNDGDLFVFDLAGNIYRIDAE